MSVNFETSLLICTEECFLFLLFTPWKDPACGLFLVLNAELKRVRPTWKQSYHEVHSVLEL